MNIYFNDFRVLVVTAPFFNFLNNLVFTNEQSIVFDFFLLKNVVGTRGNVWLAFVTYFDLKMDLSLILSKFVLGYTCIFASI